MKAWAGPGSAGFVRLEHPSTQQAVSQIIWQEAIRTDKVQVSKPKDIILLLKGG